MWLFFFILFYCYNDLFCSFTCYYETYSKLTQTVLNTSSLPLPTSPDRSVRAAFSLQVVFRHIAKLDAFKAKLESLRAPKQVRRRD